MAIELNNRTRILAGVVVLAAAGAGAWFFLFQDEPPPPAKVALKPPAKDAGDTKELRASSGKHYSDKELKGVLLTCVMAAFSQEERHRPVNALCEELLALHEGGKEQEASKTMRKALDLMLASGILKQEQEKDDPWKSEIPAKALAIKPDYYTATRNLGESLSFKGDRQGVEDYYRKAYALAEKFDIRDMELYERFASVISSKGRQPQAKQILQKGLQLDPSNTRLLGALGAIHEQEKDFKSAITYYERAALAKPPAPGGAPAATKLVAQAPQDKPAAPVAVTAAPAAATEPPGYKRAANVRDLYTRYNDPVTATVMRDRAAVKELLDDGKNPNARQTDGFTLLMIAASIGDTEIAALLLAKGADPNLRAGGRSALSIAKSRGSAGMVQLLERSGARD